MSHSYYIWKRTFDVCTAGMLLLLVLPMMVLVAILIKLESPGPILFRQIRIGRRGEAFTIYKFRSMVVHKTDDRQTHLDDPRVTRVGRLIRRYKIDELPQLWNVIRGDMSLVGPRPALPSHYGTYTLTQRCRLHTLPGITGWAQVNGNTILPWQDRIELDVWYVDHYSIWLDLKILLMTTGIVLFDERWGIEKSSNEGAAA